MSRISDIKTRIEASGRNRLVSARLIGISETSKWHKRLSWLPNWGQRGFVHLAFAGTRFANRVLPGYVSPNDAGKYELVVDHDGPASYTQGGPNFTSGGDPLNALDLGMSGFESVGVDSAVNATSVNASFGAAVVEIKLGGSANGIPFGASALSSLAMFWFQSPTRGTEIAGATNLSGVFVRLRIMCV